MSVCYSIIILDDTLLGENLAALSVQALVARLADISEAMVGSTHLYALVIYRVCCFRADELPTFAQIL